jgi:hypothetical protein
VIFIEGELDPWRPLQMKSEALKQGNVLIVVKGMEALIIEMNNH